MKCDEGKPECRNCVRRKIQCPGYVKPLKWSTKYERFKPPKTAEVPVPTLDANHESEVDRTSSQRNRQNRRDSETSSKSRSGDEVELTDANEPEESGIRVSTNQDGNVTRFDTGIPHGPFARAQNDADNSLDDWEFQQVAGDDPIIDMDQDEHAQNEQLLSNYSMRTEWDLPLALHAYFTPSDGDEHAERLMLYYFQAACRIMSCFDSPINPYRTDIPKALQSTRHIFHCMLTMAAAHLANYDRDMTVATLTYQTKAMNILQEEMLKLSLDENRSLIPASSRYQVLVGTIMLGMTSAWHDPSAYALSYLKGARGLFQAWSTEECLVDSSGNPRIIDRDQNFIIGSMAYWECLASFLTDQSLDTLDYLAPFCLLAEGQMVFSHPWTGISTPTFIRLAQVGTLLRQKRVLSKLDQIKRGCPMATEANSGLLEDAKFLHEQVLDYKLPSYEDMEDTGDENCPLSHLCDVAKIYRFVTLLELYQAFPSLAQQQSAIANTSLPSRELVFDIATSALAIMSDLPRNSGVYTVLAIAYISTGSALQPALAPAPKQSDGSLLDELNSVRRTRSVSWWRENVRQQIVHTYKTLGIASVQRGAKLVQEVWSRSDLQAEMEVPGVEGRQRDECKPVHWIDVMIEQRLETLYG